MREVWLQGQAGQGPTAMQVSRAAVLRLSSCAETVQLCCQILSGHCIVPQPLAAPKAEGWARDQTGQLREQWTGQCRWIPSHKLCLGVRLLDPCGARLLWVVLKLSLSPIPRYQD